MSYVDQDKSFGRSSIAAVALLHLALGYGFYSGLAYNVIAFVDRPIVAENYADEPPPPPHDMPPPRSEPQPPLSAAERPVVDLSRQLAPVETFPLQPPVPATVTPDVPRDVPPPPPPPAHASQARGASPLAARASWVTSDDYPAAALREGVEGIVAIAVTIGTDGRVTACAVTAGSGDAALDQATCRLYARRARFAPALDDDGRPVAASRGDRVRWQIPAQ